MPTASNSLARACANTACSNDHLTNNQRKTSYHRPVQGVDYRLLPPVEEDGHYLINSPDAARYWGPIVDKFVATLH